MSIYRGWRPRPEDIHASSIAHLGNEQSREGDAMPPPIHLRRAQPVNTLLPTTAIWLADIPEKLRPTALATQFPRIANLLCAAWRDPDARGAYLENLLTGGGRPNRKGFPPTVLRDLQRMHACHAILCGLKQSIWSGSARESFHLEVER